MALTKEQIVAACKLPVVQVEIEGLGPVNIRTLSVADKERYERRFMNADGTKNLHRSPSLYAGLIAICLVGDDGKPMFSEQEINDQFPGLLGQKLFLECAKVQGDGDDAKELLKKNSEAAPTA